MKRWLWMGVALWGLAEPGWAWEFGIGPRLGLTRRDNAIELGGQLRIGDFGLDALRPLRLNLNGNYASGKTGDSDSFTALHFNANYDYVLWSPSRVVQYYPLVGVGAYRFRLEDCESSAPGCEPTKFGVNLGGGIQYRALSVDATLGIGPLPTVTIAAAFTFGS